VAAEREEFTGSSVPDRPDDGLKKSEGVDRLFVYRQLRGAHLGPVAEHEGRPLVRRQLPQSLRESQR
jgi:hypothetical protein